MGEHATEAVELERIRREATCIIIRVGLGEYLLRGPQENILIPESRVAWATVVHDLHGEGYEMVTPEEYATVTGMDAKEVHSSIHEQGSLFALSYGDELMVPLPRKEEVLPPIEV